MLQVLLRLSSRDRKPCSSHGALTNTYEDNTAGNACGCGQWLHEDCVDDCTVDDERNERLCHNFGHLYILFTTS